MNKAVIWHDVECGRYTADLPLWRRLAETAGGPVAELGAGTGRVALDLAERGHEVHALDSDPTLLGELERRARRRGLAVHTIHADAREAALPAGVRLVLATMQFLQVVGGPAARTAVLRGAAEALVPGGLFAAALAELGDALPPEDAEPPLPDVSERDGWVFSSFPLDVRPEGGGVAVERLRQAVSPAGQLTEERHTHRLDALSLDELEREAVTAGLRPEARHLIPTTPDHVGSGVLVCRR